MAGLSRASKGVPSGGNQTPYWKLNDAGVNRAFILHPDLDTVLACQVAQTFERSGGPINASWVVIDNDVYKQLGDKVKLAGKAFVWVAVEENDSYVAKLYQMPGHLFNKVSEAVNDFSKPLKGLMLQVKKVNGRWEVTAGDAPPKYKAAIAAIDPLWQEIVEKGLDGSVLNDDVYRMVGMYPTPEKEKEFLMKRCDVGSWNEVLEMFGQPPVADGGASSGASSDVDDLE